MIMLLSKIRNLVIEKYELDEENVNFDIINNTDRFYKLEATDDLTDIEHLYIIYDCSSSMVFDLKEYIKIHDVFEEKVFIPIMVFRNWDHERQVFLNLCKNSKATMLRKIKSFFLEKGSIYTEQMDILKILVDNPINYLEYNEQESGPNNLHGYIYNVSFFELKKLFNITGADLFKKNVRGGIDRNKTVDGIRKQFRNYLLIQLINELRKIPEVCKLEKSNVSFYDYFAIDDDLLLACSPDKFWFNHNGITIFSYEETEVENSGSYITLNPKKVSVINGAQTLTSFFLELEKLQEDVKDLEKNYSLTSLSISELLKNISETIKIKTIIINGPESHVRYITNGLNTQVPILEEHMLAGSELVREINVRLCKFGLKITKVGEFSPYGYGFDTLEFIKKYLIIKCKPGKSKNFQKTETNRILKDAKRDFTNTNSTDMIRKLLLLLAVDEWWKKSKKCRGEIYDSEVGIIFNKYSKSYFQSYLILRDINSPTDDELTLLYDSFLEDFKQLNDKYGLEDFKKDTIFKEYKTKYSKKETENNSSSNIIDRYNNELIAYLNLYQKNPYSLSKTISDFLKLKNVKLDKFRVISRINKKVCEAFPFSNTCFSELYQIPIINDYFDESCYIPFADSLWEQELLREYNVFIIDKEKSGNSITEIRFIENFSFKKYVNRAEVVFDKTITAFKNGKEYEFPKMSDDLYFHVRPKAINANDTFEFSNGEQITKRTFWANKKTLNELIHNLLDED